MYKPPKGSNLLTFFRDLTFLLNEYLGTCNNVVVMGNFNIDVKEIKVTNRSLEKLNIFHETLAYQIWSRVTLVSLNLTSHL